MKEESGVLRVRQGLSRDVLGAWGPDRGTLNAESQTGNTRKGSHVTSPSGLILQKEAYIFITRAIFNFASIIV